MAASRDLERTLHLTMANFCSLLSSSFWPISRRPTPWQARRNCEKKEAEIYIAATFGRIKWSIASTTNALLLLFLLLCHGLLTELAVILATRATRNHRGVFKTKQSFFSYLNSTAHKFSLLSLRYKSMVRPSGFPRGNWLMRWRVREQFANWWANCSEK